jgi:hypothetical protein
MAMDATAITAFIPEKTPDLETRLSGFERVLLLIEIFSLED